MTVEPLSSRAMSSLGSPPASVLGASTGESGPPLCLLHRFLPLLPTRHWAVLLGARAIAICSPYLQWATGLVSECTGEIIEEAAAFNLTTAIACSGTVSTT